MKTDMISPKVWLAGMMIFGMSLCGLRASAQGVEAADSLPAKPRKTFVEKLPRPLRWLAKNWSAYDPRYSTPSFYNWVGQFQNTFTNEVLDIRNDEGMRINMHSKLSSRIGPQLGYSFLAYGFSVDLNALGGTKRKNEFTLAINSNLMNIDIIRRRTGGDFRVKKAQSEYYDLSTSQSYTIDMTDEIRPYESIIPDLVQYDVTGININYFTNHKRYSNPAAFSNGAIQLRSVGSPIVGFGYTHQKVATDLSDAIVNSTFNKVASKLSQQDVRSLLDKAELMNGREFAGIADYTTYLESLYGEGQEDLYLKNIKNIYNNQQLRPYLFGEVKYDEDGELEDILSWGEIGAVTNRLPSVTTIDDWHLQLGYAYNLVFSRRLLLGVSLVTSPGIKRVKYDNRWGLSYLTRNELAEALNDYYRVPLFEGDDFEYKRRQTSIGNNFFVRASLTYNHNRWRAGINANLNAFIYKSDDLTIKNSYGSANVYVGYCFGRKKQYRWNGKDRQAYITSALTRRQIEEMNDTMPDGNLSRGREYQDSHRSTRYHTDRFNFEIIGCDLVEGPDGHYGTFEIADGLITPGQDTDGRLKPGTKLEMDHNGDIHIEVGHKQGFPAANWWKSQLEVDQTPTHWYPEMLHYALRGRLTMYVRGRMFGTKEPVPVVIDDFCMSHGNETKEFYQIGAKQFYSHSSYSIIGTTSINNRLCRVYIESKNGGKKFNLYINRLKASGRSWMKRVDDERAIGRMSIPGTHDAGSASLPESGLTHMGHTQNFTVTEQLDDGIRAFDIRLKKNMKYGHTMTCREGFDESLVDIRRFLSANPSEFIVAMIGSDEGGKWSDEMKANFNALMSQYSDLIVDRFDATTPLKDVRGKILVIRRQEECPYGKLLKFEDNKVFTYNGFCVEDVYKEHKTYKKIKIVERHLRDAYENDDPSKWYVTFNSIAWDPRHHKPYYSAWGAVNVRKPMNKALREVIEVKGYNSFGMVFLDFYNDHGDNPQLVESIINSNFQVDDETDYIPSM